MGTRGRTSTRMDTLGWPARLAVFAALLALLVGAWYAVLMAPLAQHKVRLQAEAARQQQRLAEIETGGAGKGGESALEDKRARAAALKFDIDKLDQRIRHLKGEMIDPGRMAAVLHSLLTRRTRLTLVSIESLAPKPLVDKPLKAGADGVRHVFMHGVRIRFKGGYMDTLRYLKALEGLRWRFFWDELDYDVKDYPRGEGTLVVYTMSMAPGWIGA